MTLVPLSSRHLERTRQWTNDPELARLLGRSAPVAEDEHATWFAQLSSRSDTLYMAIEDTASGAHIGNVWLATIDDRHRRAELRIVIGDRDHLGRGAGTEAIKLLCAYGFRALRLHKVYAFVLAFNERALRSFIKAGFSVEGVLKQDRLSEGSYVDVHTLGLLRPRDLPE